MAEASQLFDQKASQEEQRQPGAFASGIMNLTAVGCVLRDLSLEAVSGSAQL
ncbi:hypothetical protein MN608_07221 [Microdochium nivale]|nr:hypothetical protein MN608_07221 [Microdochium nivale]